MWVYLASEAWDERGRRADASGGAGVEVGYLESKKKKWEGKWEGGENEMRLNVFVCTLNGRCA